MEEFYERALFSSRPLIKHFQIYMYTAIYIGIHIILCFIFKTLYRRKENIVRRDGVEVAGWIQGRTQAYVCTQKRPHRFRKKKNETKKKERKKEKRNGRERTKTQFSYSRIVNNIAYRSASIVTVRWPMSRIVGRTLHGVGLYYVGPTCTLPQRT